MNVKSMRPPQKHTIKILASPFAWLRYFCIMHYQHLMEFYNDKSNATAQPICCCNVKLISKRIAVHGRKQKKIPHDDYSNTFWVHSICSENRIKEGLKVDKYLPPPSNRSGYGGRLMAQSCGFTKEKYKH